MISHTVTQAELRRAYKLILAWRDRELADRFSAAVLEFVRREHPADLTEGDSL